MNSRPPASIAGLSGLGVPSGRVRQAGLQYQAKQARAQFRGRASRRESRRSGDLWLIRASAGFVAAHLHRKSLPYADDDGMFKLMHEMLVGITTAPAFIRPTQTVSPRNLVATRFGSGVDILALEVADPLRGQRVRTAALVNQTSSTRSSASGCLDWHFCFDNKDLV